MPEGPEVKTIASTLKNHLIKQVLDHFWCSDKALREPIDEVSLKKLTGQSINDVSSYGKILFINVNNETKIKVQLGMTGQLIVCDITSKVLPHTHVRWRLKHTSQELRYVDPRRFGVFNICDDEKKEQVISILGPDPFFLTKSDYPNLIKKCQKSRRSIKDILLDQNILAGVGNIYAAEALFLSGIYPDEKACDILDSHYEKLFEAVINVMRIGYKNGGTSFSNFVDGSGKKGKNIDFVKVFQRQGQPCHICQTKIERIKQGGRSTCYCPKCQSP
jgi:formamidopyrimidine-DNA glycosylase